MEAEKQKSWLLKLAATCLLLCALLASQIGSARAAQVDPNIEFKELMKEIRGLAKTEEKRDGFVKSVVSKVNLKAPGYSVMVCNMNQPFERATYGWQYFDSVYAFGRNYGIWIFPCGTFRNRGARGWENWGFSGDRERWDNGNVVIFYRPDCPNPAYRRHQFLHFNNKDYPGSDIREWAAVESIGQCEVKVAEIDSNLGVYLPDRKLCLAKSTNNGGAGLYSNEGSYVGDYDIPYQDVAVTTNTQEFENWKKSGNCDVMISLKGDRYFCKLFAHRDKAVVLVRKTP